MGNRMLDVGDTAPDFVFNDDEGLEISLDDLLASGPLIVYFYPADFTAVCTAEACEFRDVFADIRNVKANIVGVSPQNEASHSRFKKRYDLPFPLIADTNKTLIKAFGVNGPLGFGVRRATFLINPDKTIAKRVLADFAVKHHMQLIDDVVEDLGGY